MLRIVFVTLFFSMATSPARANGPFSLDMEEVPPVGPRPASPRPPPPPPRAPAPPRPPSGLLVVFPQANVSLPFPSVPTRTETTYRLLDGTAMRRIDAVTDSNGFSYVGSIHVAERSLGGSELERLSSRVDDLLEDSEDSEVQRSESVWYRGLPGVDLQILDRAQDRIVHVRLLVGRSRSYALVVSGPSRVASTLAGRRDAFFGGLVPTPGDAPSAFGNGQVTDGRARWLYPPEGRFAVELPGDAIRNELRLALGEREYDGYRYSVVGGTPSVRHDVIVLWFDGRSPADALTAFEAYVIGERGTVRTRRDTAREGHGSRELVIESEGTTRTAAIVVTETRLYAVIHTSGTADEARLTAARDRFFETFRILGDMP